MSETIKRLPGQAPPGQVGPGLPFHPPVFPSPVTFEFSVPSLTVKNPRALFTDTDFATIAVAVLAPDGTQIAAYGPTSKYLGDLGKGTTLNPYMSLMGIDVPDGGWAAFTFVVINHGAWIGDDQALQDLDTIGAAVLGAVVQGAILSHNLSWVSAAIIAAAVLTALAGLTVILADCDGTVVAGGMTIGKTELLEYAVQPLEVTQDYPGTDSAIGCGANSDYTVSYYIGQTPTMVATPQVLGMMPEEAGERIQAAGLHGVMETVTGDLDPGIVSAQSPTAGVSVPIGSTVQFTVHDLPPGGHPD
jgi:PASTA domain